jgi:hypothetical protein
MVEKRRRWRNGIGGSESKGIASVADADCGGRGASDHRTHEDAIVDCNVNGGNGTESIEESDRANGIAWFTTRRSCGGFTLWSFSS